MTPPFGAVVLVSGGLHTSKPRPVLVVQNPDAPTGGSVIVMPFTTTANPAIPCRVPIRASAGNGLRQDCRLEVDKVSAIRTSWLGPQVGSLEADALDDATAWTARLLAPGAGSRAV